MEGNDCLFPISDLHKFPSAQEGNRHVYLVKHVLDLYFLNDLRVRPAYFSSEAP